MLQPDEVLAPFCARNYPAEAGRAWAVHRACTWLVPLLTTLPWVSLESSLQQSQQHPYDLSLGLQDAGWKTEKQQLEVDEWRATWLLSTEKKVL